MDSRRSKDARNSLPSDTDCLFQTSAAMSYAMILWQERFSVALSHLKYLAFTRVPSGAPVIFLVGVA